MDHVRTSNELEILLNYNHELSDEIWYPGERQTLERIKLAIKFKQKTVSTLIFFNYIYLFTLTYKKIKILLIFKLKLL